MAFIHVKADDSSLTIESPMTSLEAYDSIGMQMDRNSDFIFIENHVFSKLYINHIEVTPHEDEQGETEQNGQGGANDAKKEPDYMG